MGFNELISIMLYFKLVLYEIVFVEAKIFLMNVLMITNLVE